MAPRSSRTRAGAGRRPALEPRSAPGFVVALLLPTGVAAGTTLLSRAFGLHETVSLLACAAAAFVLAATILSAVGRRHAARSAGAPPASIERERLSGLTVGEIARPLDDLVAAPENAGARELLRLMRATGHRWIPLRAGSPTHFEDAVPLRHLILTRARDEDARPLAVTVPRLDARAPAVEALSALRPGGAPAAVESEGRVIGFLTRHDVAEVALGRERLPHGRMLERPAWFAREGAAVVHGEVALSEVVRRFGVAEGTGGETLAAALLAHLGRTLGPGESLEWGGLRFTVEEFVAREPVRFRIERVVERS